MKRFYTVLMAIAVMLLVTSCGNKVDKLLDKYEDAVNKYVEDVRSQEDGDILGDLASGAKLTIKISDIENELSECEGEMTEEQIARMNEIREKLLGASIEGTSNMIDDALDISEDMDDAFDMLDDED